MRTKVLKALKESNERYLSGEELSQKIGVSRTSVWKHIKKLRQEGYHIESVASRGYRLIEETDVLSEAELELAIQEIQIIDSVTYLKTVGSTNSYAKKMADQIKNGALVISDEQTGGRGRLGRNWVSPPATGIWMSLILMPDIAPYEASKITQIAAAAVTKALALTTGMEFAIKWPNDILLNGKKVCGILTEMSAELNSINYLIVGIGINVNMDVFPDEIKEIATSLRIESGKQHRRHAIVAEILKQFEALYKDFLTTKSMEKALVICRLKSAVLGKNVRIIKKNQTMEAKAIDISSDGELIIEKSDGQQERIFSGEVSVRGLDGYI